MWNLQISDETVEERQQFSCAHHNKHSHGESDEDLETLGELFRNFVLSEKFCVIRQFLRV